PPIVEQDVPVDHDVIADLEIVPERELHEVECLEVPPDPAEDVRRQDPPEPDAEVDVTPERRPVEHLPHPDEGFPLVETFYVDLRVVLWFERDFPGVHLRERNP